MAPDLIGHGDSATPRGDNSLGAHAAGIRDLLTAIGIDKATIVLLSLAAHDRVLSGAPLKEPGARDAFLQTLRAVIDVRGQRVSARDRLYLLGAMPTLIVRGKRDNMSDVDWGIVIARRWARNGTLVARRGSPAGRAAHAAR